MDDVEVDFFGLLGTPITDVGAHPSLFGRLSSPELIEDRTHVTAPDMGIGFVDHGDGVVSTIHLHCDSGGGMDAFSGELPLGLSSTMTRSELRALLGTPEASGDSITLPGLGAKPPWDRFFAPRGVIHVSYRIDRPGLSLVTMMLREVVPEVVRPAPDIRIEGRAFEGFWWR